MAVKVCPRCRVVSDADAVACDCGHEFAAECVRSTPPGLPRASLQKQPVIPESTAVPRSLDRVAVGIGVVIVLHMLLIGIAVKERSLFWQRVLFEFPAAQLVYVAPIAIGLRISGRPRAARGVWWGALIGALVWLGECVAAVNSLSKLE